MNYFERHIGDYLKDTAHLSLLEHGIYGRLMDVYYTRESGIPAAEAARLIGARSKEERAALTAVLAEFFALSDAVYMQGRCDREIERFHDKQEKAKRSAEARWSESGRNANASIRRDAKQMRTHSDGNAPSNQTPDSNHQTPIPEGQETSVPDGTGAAGAEPAKKPKATDPNEIIFGYGVPMLTAAGSSDKHARSFLGGLRKAHGDEALIGKMRECLKAKPLQPLEWLAAALPPPSSQTAGERSEDAIRAENARTTAEAKRALFGAKTPETFDA